MSLVHTLLALLILVVATRIVKTAQRVDRRRVVRTVFRHEHQDSTYGFRQREAPVIPGVAVRIVKVQTTTMVMTMEVKKTTTTSDSVVYDQSLSDLTSPW